MVKDFEKQFTELKKKDEDKLTKQEKQTLKQQEAMVNSYKRMLDQSKKKKAEDYINAITSRLRIINALAVSDKDLYVACGEMKGYGYAVWRMDRNLERSEASDVGIGGCCGQMDIQCCGDDLVVAENSEHQCRPLRPRRQETRHVRQAPAATANRRASAAAAIR